jgi:hypothetical protein
MEIYYNPVFNNGDSLENAKTILIVYNTTTKMATRNFALGRAVWWPPLINRYFLGLRIITLTKPYNHSL